METTQPKHQIETNEFLPFVFDKAEVETAIGDNVLDNFDSFKNTMQSKDWQTCILLFFNV